MKNNKLITILLCVNIIIGIITLGGVGYLVINNDGNMKAMEGGMPGGGQNFPGETDQNPNTNQQESSTNSTTE